MHFAALYIKHYRLNLLLSFLPTVQFMYTVNYNVLYNRCNRCFPVLENCIFFQASKHEVLYIYFFLFCSSFYYSNTCDHNHLDCWSKFYKLEEEREGQVRGTMGQGDGTLS